MENVKVRGIYFNEADIKAIIEKHMSWAEIEENQIFCADNVMNDNTPIGTAIIVGVDGIKCDADSKEIRLVLSSGIYEIAVKTINVNDKINVRFDQTIHVPGTYGKMDNGVLDILTDEEKEFKKSVDDMLGYRDDEYANMMRRDNTRNVGGRGLILLEKIKAEIKNDNILSNDEITPIQLISVFIEVTDKYLNSEKSVEELTQRHDEILAQYKETFAEDSKLTKKLARDIEVINQKIDANHQVKNFCLTTINTVIIPVLNAEVEC